MKKVFVNGSFDILHPGHIELLNYAKSLGNHLMVALDSDERISKRKGPNRPINNLKFRLTMMSNIKAVNSVKYFSSDKELIDIISNYSPDFMVIGNDYNYNDVIGKEHAKKLIIFERNKEYSSTNILKKINRITE
jgi:rfaE bifunctional protein nucleotidyltransferase chain/domain